MPFFFHLEEHSLWRWLQQSCLESRIYCPECSTLPLLHPRLIWLYGSLYSLVTASSGTFTQPSKGQWKFATLAGIHLLKCRPSVVRLHVNKWIDSICKQWKKRMNVKDTIDFILKVDTWKSQMARVLKMPFSLLSV